MSEICKAAGALVTENDRLWRIAHALSCKNYRIPGNSNLQYYLLKRPLVEKSIDALAPSPDFVNNLEEICINEPELRFNTPKNMEESKMRFEYNSSTSRRSLLNPGESKSVRTRVLTSKERLGMLMPVISVCGGTPSPNSEHSSANYAEMSYRGVTRGYWNPIRLSIHPRA